MLRPLRSRLGRALVPGAFALVALRAVGACESRRPVPDPVDITIVTVGPDGGIVPTTDGVLIIVPPGAVDTPTVFTVKRLNEGAVTAPPQLLPVGDAFDIDAEGKRFKLPVQLVLPFAIDRVPQNPNGHVGVFRSTDGASWTELPSGVEEGRAGTETEELSLWRVFFGPGAPPPGEEEEDASAPDATSPDGDVPDSAPSDASSDATDAKTDG